MRLDRQATSLSIAVALGVRADGQKVLLGFKVLAGRSQAAWPDFLDDLVGPAKFTQAPAALWPTAPVQRCTVHERRNLLAQATKKCHDELSANYRGPDL